MRKWFLALTVLALICLSCSLVVAAANEGKGCGTANCHAVGDKWSLAAEVEVNYPNHPPVNADSLYEDCLRCHKTGKLAFGPILHKGHYKAGDNHCTSNPDNNCQSCHQIDLTTGVFGVVYAK